MSVRAIGVLLCALEALSCTRYGKLPNLLQSFAVQLSKTDPAQPTGTADKPMAFVSGAECADSSTCENGETCEGGRCSRCWTLDVEARGRDGEPFDFSGMVHVAASPGFVSDNTARTSVQAGVAKSSRACINRTTGKTNIWVEDDGYLPRPVTKPYGECNDGLDNDGNGRIDLADPGCLDVLDDLEAGVTAATGISQTLYFDTPTVRQVQRAESIARSPMVSQQVLINHGGLLVTNVTSNGFYLTDMSDATDPKHSDFPFASLFVFTFSAPEDVKLGYLVCWVSGGVQDHVGMTQLTFPTYITHNPVSKFAPRADCDRDLTAYLGLTVEPAGAGTDVTPRLVAEDRADKTAYTANVYQNSKLLESFESGLIKVTDLEVSTRFISCDRNQNGSIEKGDEDECRNACRLDNLCTDLDGFFEYRQWSAFAQKKKKMGLSVSQATGFVPLSIEYLGQNDRNGLCDVRKTALGFLEYTCAPRTVASATGSLRHIYLCGNGNEATCDLQLWILDPRFDTDLVLPQDLDQDKDGLTPAAGDCNDNNPAIQKCDGATK